MDQRENREHLAGMTAGKSVLDLCSHAGGFAIYAKAKGGALQVVAVDRVPLAIAQGRANAQLNQVAIEFTAADLNDYFRESTGAFDVVVLDPPKETNSKEGLHGALQRYVDWSTRAVERVAPGGLLLTCSCSGWVKEKDFREVLAEVELRSRRSLRIEKWLGAGTDHPVSPLAPETDYLKVAWVRVA